MYDRHDWIRWAGCAALTLCASAFMAHPAHAAGDRISFSGAIVAPTCGLDSGSIQQVSQNPAHAVDVSCASTRNNPQDASSYQLKVTTLNGASVDPRVQTYFQRFSPDAGAMVAVQTYH